MISKSRLLSCSGQMIHNLMNNLDAAQTVAYAKQVRIFDFKKAYSNLDTQCILALIYFLDSDFSRSNLLK